MHNFIILSDLVFQRGKCLIKTIMNIRCKSMMIDVHVLVIYYFYIICLVLMLLLPNQNKHLVQRNHTSSYVLIGIASNNINCRMS